MPTLYKYSEISQLLIDNLIDDLLRGQSSIVLGPRYQGKRYLLKHIHKLLCAMPILNQHPIVWISCPEEGYTTREENKAFIDACVKKSVESTTLNTIYTGETIKSSAHILASIEWLAEKSEKTVIVLMPIIDTVPYTVVREILAEMQRLASDRKVCVLFTGEQHLIELTYDPLSEFRVGAHYFIKGFDKTTYKEYFKQRSSDYNLLFANFDDTFNKMWDLTYGNTEITRRLITLTVREMLEKEGTLSKEQPILSNRIVEITKYEPRTFRQIRNRAAQLSVSDLQDLQTLIHQKSIPIATTTIAPTPLELIGIAWANSRNKRLEFKNPVIEKYVCKHFDHLWFGDIFALKSQWSLAFGHYDQLSPEERLRPSNPDDDVRLQAPLSAFHASLAQRDVDEDREEKVFKETLDLFRKGSQYLLGISDVVYLTYSHQTTNKITGQYENHWIVDTQFQESTIFLNPTLKDALLRLNPSRNRSLSKDIIELGKDWKRFVIGIEVPHINHKSAIILLGDFHKQTVLSGVRRKRICELLHSFQKYSVTAIKNDIMVERLERRTKWISLIHEVYQKLGESNYDTNQIMTLARNYILTRGYSQVLISIVDSKHERLTILGEEDGNLRMKKGEWSYSLLAPGNKYYDIQPYAIRNVTPMWIDDIDYETFDPKNHGFDIDVEGCKRNNVKAFAVVPMIDDTNRAIGAIHVERSDQLPVSKDEIEDLELFGKQLANLIKQNKRMVLLLKALDSLHRSVIIFDENRILVYANQKSEELFDIPKGIRPKIAEDKFGEYLKSVVEDCDLNIFGDDSKVNELQSTKEFVTKKHTGFAILTKLTGLNESDLIGAVAEFRDLRSVYSIFNLIPRIADKSLDLPQLTKELVRVISRIINCKSIRVYELDTYMNKNTTPRDFTCQAAYECDSNELRETFNWQGVRLSGYTNVHNNHEPSTWACIREGTVKLFEYRVESGHNTISKNKFGLPVKNVLDILEIKRLGKQNNECWIDFPLAFQSNSNTVYFGKISIICNNRDVFPEDFTFLNILREFSERIFTAHNTIKDAMREGAEDSMGQMSHNLKTFLNDRLKNIINEQHRLYTKSKQELDENWKTELGNLFSLIAETTNTVMRVLNRNLSYVSIKEHLEVKVVDISEFFKSISINHNTLSLKIINNHKIISCLLDEDLCHLAILELIHNSMKFAKESIPIDITIDLTVSNIDRNALEIHYRDNGIGIVEENKYRIFDNYYTSQQKHDGVGLGLTFVNRTVEAHGGSVQVNDYRDGAYFILHFPNANPKLSEMNYE